MLRARSEGWGKFEGPQPPCHRITRLETRATVPSGTGSTGRGPGRGKISATEQILGEPGVWGVSPNPRGVQAQYPERGTEAWTQFDIALTKHRRARSEPDTNSPHILQRTTTDRRNVRPFVSNVCLTLLV